VGKRAHGTDKAVKKAEKRSKDERVQAAMEATRKAQAELDALIERQKKEPAIGEVAGAMYAAELNKAQEAVDQAAAEQAKVVMPAKKTAASRRKHWTESLRQDGEGNFPFALTMARKMLKQGYNIRYVIDFTGVGYLELKECPIDEDGFGSENIQPDYKESFLSLYEAVAACEAPEGTQVDEVLAEFQERYNRAKENVK